MRVLVAEDDRDIAELLTIYLMNEGYQVENAYDGEEALQRIEESNFNLILLDVMMPKVDGFTVVETVRKNNNSVPIIILSARTNDTDKIRGFLLGADDYVAKPFNPVEVIARIKAIVRRSQKEISASSGEYIMIGGTVKMREYDRKLFTLDDVEIRLTNYEYQIFALLVSQSDKAFSAKEIYEKVWHNHSKGSPKSVLVHVSHLRDKILQATGSNLIQTVWGVGYKIKE